jgi:alpha-amylase
MLSRLLQSNGEVALSISKFWPSPLLLHSSILYRIITDRFALPENSTVPLNACDTMKQRYCGGTWNSIRSNLDYIQDMGFTAIWISPVNKNIEGITAYGEPYHGYWVEDISKLNSHFGTAADLKTLSADLHARGMYLMVDIVVNNVVATTTEPDLSQFFFKIASQYHPYWLVLLPFGPAT